MLTVTSEVATTPTIFLNLWKHECNRVIADRFTNQQDKDWFEKAIKQVVEEDFDAETSGLLEAEPYFVDFMRDAPEPTGKEKSASNPRQLLPFPKCITLFKSWFQQQWQHILARSIRFPSVQPLFLCKIMAT